MFALLNFYMLLLVQTDPNNLTGRQLQSALLHKGLKG